MRLYCIEKTVPCPTKNVVNKTFKIHTCLKSVLLMLFVFVALAGSAVAEAKAIPSESVDDQKIFRGIASKFEKPASVDYVTLVTATKEYQRARKIESGTARYWILVNKANESAVRAINAVGSETDYDLIVVKGYLEGLDPPIETEDITELALAKLQH